MGRHQTNLTKPAPSMGVRVSEKVEEMGLDLGEHAEEAYADEEEYKLGDKEHKLGKEDKNKL